jgi:starch synthase
MCHVRLWIACSNVVDELFVLQVNGFNFEGTDSGALDYAMNRAIDCFYNDRQFFNTIALRCMATDWSWNGPAHDYVELYYKALK